MVHPRLWWPNGFGPQNLYKLHLNFEVGRKDSDGQDVMFGVRKITYTLPGSDNLAISVNGVPVFIRGGDWGLDEAMKRIPRERLEAEIRMHQLADLNLIRNWVGQSTGEDFYELCDKYGILLWDEFFQPNPSDGPTPRIFRRILRMCGIRFCGIGTILRLRFGARGMKGIRRRISISPAQADG